MIIARRSTFEMTQREHEQQAKVLSLIRGSGTLAMSLSQYKDIATEVVCLL